jgi:hypothetical protein
MISARYAPTLLVLLTLALIPTVIHSYAGLTVQDGKSTATIPARLAGFAGAAGSRNAGWGQRHFGSTDWFSRQYVSPTATVTLTAVRAYDLKTLYHHPELAVAYDTPFSAYRVGPLAGHPDVPVHVLSDGRGAIGLYVLLYDNAYVSDPLWFQLRTAGALLVGGRRPMTLLFARQTGVRPGSDPGASDAATILFAALDAFNRQ